MRIHKIEEVTELLELKARLVKAWQEAGTFTDIEIVAMTKDIDYKLKQLFEDGYSDSE